MHPPELLALMRTGSGIQIEWMNALVRRTKQFLKQLPAPARVRKAPGRKKVSAARTRSKRAVQRE